MANAEMRMKISADASGMVNGVKKAKSSIQGLGRTLQTALGFGLANIASRITDLFKNMVTFAIKTTARFETLGVQFETLIGNAVLANKVMRDLRQFSVETPFTPEEVFRASKALLAFGFAASEQIKIIKQLGDVSAISGKNLEEIAFIYGKVFSRGKAQMRELNQLIWAGVPIMEELAKQTGKTQNEMFEMSRKGEITFSMIEKAFKNMTSEGGRFADGAAKRAMTLEGRWSTLIGVVAELGDTIGKMFKDDMLSSLNVAIDLVNDFAYAFKELNKTLRGTETSFSALESFVMLPQMLVDGDLEKNMEEFDKAQQRIEKIAEKNAAKRDAERRKRLGEGESVADATSKALSDSRAAAGLFAVGRPTMDVQQLILDETKIQTEFLKETNATLKDIRMIQEALNVDGAIKNMERVMKNKGIRGGAL